MPLETPSARRRARRNARIALYGSLLLTGALGFLLLRALEESAAAKFVFDWVAEDYPAREEVQLLQSLVRINTTPDTGREIDAARFISAWLEREAGLEAEVEELPGGKANLRALVEGADPRPLVLHSHLDTDPTPELGKWSHPPFAGEIVGPWIHGRGTFDMKSVTAAQMLAFREVARRTAASGEPPLRSVLLLATSSEETGSELGARRLVEREPEWVEGFWAVLSEGGVVEALDHETIKYWGISFGQKQFVDGRACADDRAGLEALAAWLEEQRGRARLRLPDAVRRFAAAYAPSRFQPAFREALEDPEAVFADEERFDRLPPYMKSFFRNELHLLLDQPAPGEGACARLVLHVLPGSSFEEATEELLGGASPPVGRIELDEPFGRPLSSPLDHPVLETARDVVGEAFPEALIGPYFLALYANDCRFFRLRDVPCYGFWPFATVSTDTFTVAGFDERISLPAYVDGVALYDSLVRALTEP